MTLSKTVPLSSWTNWECSHHQMVSFHTVEHIVSHHSSRHPLLALHSACLKLPAGQTINGQIYLWDCKRNSRRTICRSHDKMCAMNTTRQRTGTIAVYVHFFTHPTHALFHQPRHKIKMFPPAKQKYQLQTVNSIEWASKIVTWSKKCQTSLSKPNPNKVLELITKKRRQSSFPWGTNIHHTQTHL